MLRRKDASKVTLGSGTAKRGLRQKAGVGRTSDSKRGEIKALDALCREIVMLRDNNTCQKCGRTDRIQWAHIVTRGIQSMRWEPDNSFALCQGCHYHGHLNPLQFMLWFTQTYPARAARLTMMRQTTHKLDRKGMMLWLKMEISKVVR